MLLLFLSLIFMALFLDLYENGFAIGGACDFGFGKRLRAVQEASIRGYFLEELPKAIDVESVTCTGFTDSNFRHPDPLGTMVGTSDETEDHFPAGFGVTECLGCQV